MKRFREYEPRQVLLMPPSLDDWLPAGHLAHFISEVVEQLDLSAIYADYPESRGQPPYDPRMMVKIWFYGYCKGVRSSRRVERAVQEDVGFRYLAANQQPKFWALNAFRTRHRQALGGMFVQTVHLAVRAGLVKGKHLAIDGTKVKANASKHSAMSYGRMQIEEERLRKEIEQYLNECDEVDRQEDEEFGADRRGDELPGHLATREQRLGAIRRAKAELEAEAREKAREEQAERQAEAEAAGRSFRPRKSAEEAKPSPKAQRNFTDPTSRIMKTSDKSFIQAYNAQAAVDGDSQLIVAAHLTNQASDAPHLPDLLKQAKANTGQDFREASADAGYWSEMNMQAVREQGLEPFIPPRQSQAQPVAKPSARPRPAPKNLNTADRMRRKLRTKRGREHYKTRQTSVEPVFGQIKEVRGLRQFLHRGLEKVQAMWYLDCAAHNLLKLYRAGVRYGTTG